MLVSELKLLINSLPDNAEVKLRNHHLEDKPITKTRIKLSSSAGKTHEPGIVLILEEKRL